MIDSLVSSMKESPNNQANEPESTEVEGPDENTVDLIKVTFKKNRGGAGNVLDVVPDIVRMTGVKDAEIELATFQEEKVLKCRQDY